MPALSSSLTEAIQNDLHAVSGYMYVRLKNWTPRGLARGQGYNIIHYHNNIALFCLLKSRTFNHHMVTSTLTVCLWYVYMYSNVSLE